MPKAIDLRAYRHSMYIRDLAHILEVRLRKSPKRNAATSAAAVFSAKRSHLLPSGLYRRLRNLTGILPFGSRARTDLYCASCLLNRKTAATATHRSVITAGGDSHPALKTFIS